MIHAIYFSTRGRMSRRAYWLVGLLPLAGFSFIAGFLFGLARSPAGAVGLIVLLLWPTLALSIKRCHDFNASGWWAALTAVPLLNWIVEVVLGSIPGTRGANRFGPDPKTEPFKAPDVL
ncbi:MAG: DUF805 domain-containing protein [Cyanobacteria bacterium SZAS LIN-2]|nr:DUF805 domain-containing protein [Cyanobacteria bacterium SZAS LIN-2]